MRPAEPGSPLAALDALVAGWCDRRSWKALRAILPGYPLSSPFTDGWGELLRALQNVPAFARDELTDAELADVDETIRVVERRLSRS